MGGSAGPATPCCGCTTAPAAASAMEACGPQGLGMNGVVKIKPLIYKTYECRDILYLIGRSMLGS